MVRTQADENEDLDALAVETIASVGPAARRSNIVHRAVLCDGFCRITNVNRFGVSPPAIAELHTDIGEKLPIFDWQTADELEALVGCRVKLKLKVSSRGVRYPIRGTFLAPSTGVSRYYRCVQCDDPAERNAARTHYVCATCHYQMEIAP